ncbi:Gfo/Idh/MocA family protein [Fictibacillus phosphorivorans]|uniref:Gfo/Idh/MocA family protein n=1 Tax=Fictibacillus phosphorivorans TaxID=1221500 RepID=UPI0020407167|nr:Gfo/Idh/MocA family oxidoreductase [Fictibacillus phosphorivorans]MCM3720216.1 Gfo/Idh/MocA family oxidoreductase [Fictibacillus phosphorivorans]MCM3777897.1 Gfo/Idh/MocA family oxidoreductase [Fictibacillus phosphorivorans]
MSLRIGIVGTGRTIGVASDHLHGIQANPEWILSAVYDIVPKNAQHWIQQHNLSSSLICSSLEELLDKVDAVVICTDNLSHGTIAREAFKKKLPVLCEKPLSIDYYESQQLAKEAAEAGVVNYMGMQYRYHPYAQLIKEILSSGELGDIFSYRHKLGGGRIGNPNVGLEWRMKKESSGAGAVADFGIHQVDLIHFFLHETCGEIKSVQAELATFIQARQAEGSSTAPVTNDDLAVVIARLENGAMITLNNSRLLPQDGDGLEIVGTKAAISMDQHGQLFLRKKNADGSWSGEREPLEIEERHKFPGLARGKQYKEFYEAIKYNQPHELSFAYAAKAAKVIDAAVLSSQEGRRVSISEIE